MKIWPNLDNKDNYRKSVSFIYSSPNTKDPYNNTCIEMAHNCTNDLTENNKSKPSGSQTCNNGEKQKQQKIKRQQGHST